MSAENTNKMDNTGVLFPFAAVVNQEKAKEALLLAVINPAVHGVLFSGEKGTGKTTLVRSLSTLLPETQVIDLPLGCGEELIYRTVLGTKLQGGVVVQKGKNQKHVVVLLGSPRKKGNSTVLAKQIIHGVESVGAKVETVYLNGLNIKPCQGCYACKKKNSTGCAVDDDMQSLYPKLVESDAWVIASPVYWFNMSAQTKIFMDRCFALWDEDSEINPMYKKRIAIAMSYGDSDPFNSGCVNALRSFQDAYRYVGARIVGMVYGSAEEPGEIASNAELMAQAEKIGKKLAMN